jgi:hypothetical protein
LEAAVSELDVLRQRRELVLLSCDLQRATLARRLGNVQRNPVRIALGAVANAAKRPMVWRLGTTALAFAVKAYRNRSARKKVQLKVRRGILNRLKGD